MNACCKGQRKTIFSFTNFKKLTDMEKGDTSTLLIEDDA